jgi:hypothetical protein
MSSIEQVGIVHLAGAPRMLLEVRAPTTTQPAESWSLCSLRPEVEYLDHLLLSCVYSGEVWFQVLHRCGWQQLTPTLTYTFTDW